MAELRLEPCGAVNPSDRLRRNGSPGSGETPMVRGPFNPYIRSMPRKPIELPPGFARRFVEHMRAHFAETNLIKRDEIAHGSFMR